MSALSEILKDLTYWGLEKFGRYYSNYRGYVVDNDDPEGYSRITVKIPSIYGKQTMPDFAWPKNNFSGDGYGMQCLPEIGDMVWVEFMHGDARRPIWTHGHFGKHPITGKKEKPEELKDIKNRWFKTPSGHQIEFHDGGDYIRITHAKGKIIEINKNTISLGSKEKSAQPGVLGDDNEKVLENLRTELSSLAQELIIFGTAQASAAGAVPLTNGLAAAPTKLSASITAIKLKIETIKIDIPKTKSKIITLD